MLAHLIRGIAEDGDTEKTVGLQEPECLFERPLYGWRNVFDHVRQENEIVRAIKLRMQFRKIEARFTIVKSVRIVELLR